MHNDCDYTFKIILNGEYGAGKTSLLYSYVDGVLNDNCFFIAEDCKTKNINVDGKSATSKYVRHAIKKSSAL